MKESFGYKLKMLLIRMTGMLSYIMVSLILFIVAVQKVDEGNIIAACMSAGALLLFLMYSISGYNNTFIWPSDCATLYSGKYLRLMTKDGWDYVERTNTNKIAFIVPFLVDDNGRRYLIFIKEFRIPLQKYVISFPAGLVGDHDKEETMLSGAQRELKEEIGYSGTLIPLMRGPTSAGLSNEILDFFLAIDLKQEADGGKGDGTEKIGVHKVPIYEVYKWLEDQLYKEDALIDSKVYSGLYYICKYVGEVI